MRIAVLGAPGTGKTILVSALRLAQLADSGGAAGYSVDECSVLTQADRYTFILLMGLDLPQTVRAQSSNATPAHVDALLRQYLDENALAYTVVYGRGQARTDCALQAIDFQRRLTSTPTANGASAWHWNCENCSDAACEHRLFSTLVQKADVSVGL